MEASPNAVNLIKSFEGLSLKPYLCPAGVPTIGYGSTHYADGRAVKLHDNPITPEAAEQLLHSVLKPYVDGVRHMVQVPIRQGQFDALVSFAYNTGLKALQNSTLLRKLNDGDATAAGEFGKWVHVNGKVSSGLVRRRAAERKLFESTEGLPAFA